MQVISSNKTELNTVEAEFKIDGDEFEQSIQNAYLKKRKNIQIPGFRKGKASRKMIETKYGESVFYEDALNSAYNKIIKDVIDELELDVVDTTGVEVLSLDKAEGVSFKAIFTVTPEVTIGEYLDLKISVPSDEVTDEEVDKTVKELQMKVARLVEVTDRNTKFGDIITFDFNGYCDGEAFEGGSAEDFTLEIGAGKFIPGFEDQLTDRVLEEDFEINITFPEDYHAESLASKSAVFKCKIHEIKEAELPELDDEFAKDVSEFDTFEELKNDIRKEIQIHKKAERKTNIDNAIGDVIINGMECEIPNIMIEHKIDDILREWEFNNSSKGLTIDDFLEHHNTDIENFREFFRESAIIRTKFQLALLKIAELENIEISDEEYEEEIKKLAEHHKMDMEKVKKVLNPKNHKKDMKKDRAFDLIRERAIITASE